jgi:hypothetical protein
MAMCDTRQAQRSAYHFTIPYADFNRRLHKPLPLIRKPRAVNGLPAVGNLTAKGRRLYQQQSARMPAPAPARRIGNRLAHFDRLGEFHHKYDWGEKVA